MHNPQYISVEKKARYFLSGPSDKTYSRVCFALHGYGQLGQYFIRNFMHDELHDTLFIAPEGLHRFYLNGTNGRVGASWMTKEDRLTDIEDYCRYLDAIYVHFKNHIDQASEVGVLGFSQGVATACRWLSTSVHQFNFLINWAGAFPPDLNIEASLAKMRRIPVHLLVGDEDEYISLVQFEEHLQALTKQGFAIIPTIFKGTHKIYPEVLKNLFSSL
jgi:predicted esterase